MKLSELRPCDNCGQKIAPLFYVARVSQAMVMPAANQVLGMTQYFNGNLALAEMFAPEDEVVKVFGEEKKELMDELLLCSDCACEKYLNLLVLVEKRNQAKSENIE